MLIMCSAQGSTDALQVDNPTLNAISWPISATEEICLEEQCGDGQLNIGVDVRDSLMDYSM